MNKTYSFWASMMTKALSLVDAVDGATPTSSRNDLAIFIDDLCCVSRDDFNMEQWCSRWNCREEESELQGYGRLIRSYSFPGQRRALTRREGSALPHAGSRPTNNPSRCSA